MSIDCSPLHFLASPAETENRPTAFIPTSFDDIFVIIIQRIFYTVRLLFNVFATYIFYYVYFQN